MNIKDVSVLRAYFWTTPYLSISVFL